MDRLLTLKKRSIIFLLCLSGFDKLLEQVNGFISLGASNDLLGGLSLLLVGTKTLKNGLSSLTSSNSSVGVLEKLFE